MSRSPVRDRTTKAEIPPPPCDARSIDQPSAGSGQRGHGGRDDRPGVGQRRTAARRTANGLQGPREPGSVGRSRPEERHGVHTPGWGWRPARSPARMVAAGSGTAERGRRIWTIPRILWPGVDDTDVGIGVLVELSGYLAILRRWWWTLLVAAWVAGLMGYVIAGRIEPTYESSARLLVGPINSDTNTLRASSQLVQTYAELATSSGLLEATVSEMGVEPARGRGRCRSGGRGAHDRQRHDAHPDDPRRGQRCRERRPWPRTRSRRS